MKVGYFLKISFVPGIALILCTCVQNGSSTMILGSMMLAANTAMLLGKMGLGGLMMMMMAQQSNLGGTGTGTISQALAQLARKRSAGEDEGQATQTHTVLGLVNNKRTTRMVAEENAKHRHLAQQHAQQLQRERQQREQQQQQLQHGHGQVVQHPAHRYPEPEQQHHQHLYRFVRSVDDSQLKETSSTTTTTTTTTTAPPLLTLPAEPEVETTPEEEQVAVQQVLAYRRMMRQADSFDYMSCLPKFICGLEAQPPSKKTSILNDYSHLLKLIFRPDADDEDDELDDEDEGLDDEDSGERSRNQEILNDKVNEDMIDEYPEMLKYILEDAASVGGKHKSNSKRRKLPPGSSNKGKYGFRGGERPDFRYPPPDYYHDEPEPEEASSSGGFLSSLLPKVKAGFGTKTNDPDFDSDPFFSGFKRSMDYRRMMASQEKMASGGSDGKPDSNEVNVHENEQNGKRSKRISDNSRRRRRRAAIEKMLDDDPVIRKYRRAQDIGRQSQKGNQQDCTSTFRKCPYDWSQISAMVSNVRNTVLPNNGTVPTRDKIVVLQVPTAVVGAKPGGVMSTFTKHGATVMSHDMGNGNVMQITMKLAPKVTGFENTPIIEAEPYPVNDELSVESLELVPIPTKPKVVDTDSDEAIEDAVKKFLTKNNGTWSPKPRKKYKPSPPSTFQFASDVDSTGVKGGTILSEGGADFEVKLKTPSRKTRPVVSITPKGSAKSNHPKSKVKKKSPKPIEKSTEVAPGISSHDNHDNDNDSAASSEEDDDDDDDDADDGEEYGEDDFILEDRKNGRTHDRKVGSGTRAPLNYLKPRQQPEGSSGPPLSDTDTDNGQSQIVREPLPFPMSLLRPVLFDDSKAWIPIGEEARMIQE